MTSVKKTTTKKNKKIKEDVENVVLNIVNNGETKESRQFEKSEKYLSDYLNSIKHKQGKYKRVIISPLRYAGGKKAIGLILLLFQN